MKNLDLNNKKIVKIEPHSYMEDSIKNIVSGYSESGYYVVDEDDISIETSDGIWINVYDLHIEFDIITVDEGFSHHFGYHQVLVKYATNIEYDTSEAYFYYYDEDTGDEYSVAFDEAPEEFRKAVIECLDDVMSDFVR